MQVDRELLKVVLHHIQHREPKRASDSDKPYDHLHTMVLIFYLGDILFAQDVENPYPALQEQFRIESDFELLVRVCFLDCLHIRPVKSIE